MRALTIEAALELASACKMNPQQICSPGLIFSVLRKRKTHCCMIKLKVNPDRDDADDCPRPEVRETCWLSHGSVRRRHCGGRYKAIWTAAGMWCCGPPRQRWRSPQVLPSVTASCPSWLEVSQKCLAPAGRL